MCTLNYSIECTHGKTLNNINLNINLFEIENY